MPICKFRNISERDMFNTFNMGVGLSLTVSKNTADAALSSLKASGLDAYVIGEIVSGEDRICLC